MRETKLVYGRIPDRLRRIHRAGAILDLAFPAPEPTTTMQVRAADFEKMRGNPHSARFTPAAMAAGAAQIDVLGRVGRKPNSKTWASLPNPTAEVAVLHHYKSVNGSDHRHTSHHDFRPGAKRRPVPTDLFYFILFWGLGGSGRYKSKQEWEWKSCVRGAIGSSHLRTDAGGTVPKCG